MRAIPGKDTNIGAKRARETREELGIDLGVPLDCVRDLVATRLEAPVVIAALPDGVAGCCWRDGDDVVLWVNGLDQARRQRFTLAHELGHLRCRHDGAIPVETFTTLSGKSTDSREVQANAFAAELLAPAAGVQGMVDGAEPNLEHVVLIAARYGISPIAALFRLNTLELTRRYEQLKREIEEGEDQAVWDRLAPDEPEDGIGGLDPRDLPWLCPGLRGSALDAMVHGRASTLTAAEAAGCSEGALARGARTMGI